MASPRAACRTENTVQPAPNPWNLPQKLKRQGAGQVAQLVRASSRYTKVVGLIPSQDTYKVQPMNS